MKKEAIMPKIVRTYSAGVFFAPQGISERSEDGKRGILPNARRLWYWSGAASLSQLATDGPQDPKNCKFPCHVSNIELTDIIEVLDVTDKAAKAIEAVPLWAR